MLLYRRNKAKVLLYNELKDSYTDTEFLNRCIEELYDTLGDILDKLSTTNQIRICKRILILMER